MSRILVTGASGFIGQHVLPLLAAGDVDVHAVSRSPRTAQGVTFHACDLLGEPAPIFELFARVKPTHLLHLAWYLEQKKYWTSPENFRWVAASVNMARAFHENGGRRLVGVGTCAEYDWRYGFCSETLTPLGPTSPYGICKDSLRRLWQAFAQLNSLSFAWTRIFFTYGPGEPSTRLIPSVIRALLDGNVARCTHGRQLRDFMYVDDVAAALIAILKSDVEGPINIGSGVPLPLRSIVETIAEQLGTSGLVEFGALPAPDEAAMVAADVERLRREVGFTPRVDLRSGVAQAIDWWRAHREVVAR